MKKQSIAIIGVIALVLAVAVGYALFSDQLTINGTATAKGDFDVNFVSVGTPTCSGYSLECTSANLTALADDELTITVNKLEYPGAYVIIPVTVQNEGTIPAILDSIEETGLTTDGTVKVSYTGLESKSSLDSGASQTFNVKVMWDENSNVSAENVKFSIKLNYVQVSAQ